MNHYFVGSHFPKINSVGKAADLDNSFTKFPARAVLGSEKRIQQHVQQHSFKNRGGTPLVPLLSGTPRNAIART
jgi:hypothetical protein